jgi:hypothetical protein
LADNYATGKSDVVAWLCNRRTTERASGNHSRLPAIDAVIDSVKRLRGQPVWEGSLAGASASGVHPD